MEPEASCTPPDTWSYGSLDDALDWRQSTPAIWTGSEVLVWGGDVARTPFFYLVRAVNSCPAGRGPLGTGSDGSPRAGVACP